MNINLEKNTNCNEKKSDLQLEINDLIKVNDGEETFWAIISKKLRNCYLAKIDNKLLFEKKYNYGDTFKCKDEHIFDSYKI